MMRNCLSFEIHINKNPIAKTNEPTRISIAYDFYINKVKKNVETFADELGKLHKDIKSLINTRRHSLILFTLTFYVLNDTIQFHS